MGTGWKTQFTGKEPRMKRSYLLWFPLLLLLLPACSQLVTFSAPDRIQPVCLGYPSGLADSLGLHKQGEFAAEIAKSNMYLFLLFPPFEQPLSAQRTNKDERQEKFDAALGNDPAKAITGLRIETDSRMFFLGTILLNGYGDHARAAATGWIQKLPDIPLPTVDTEADDE